MKSLFFETNRFDLASTYLIKHRTVDDASKTLLDEKEREWGRFACLVRPLFAKSVYATVQKTFDAQKKGADLFSRYRQKLSRPLTEKEQIRNAFKKLLSSPSLPQETSLAPVTETTASFDRDLRLTDTTLKTAKWETIFKNPAADSKERRERLLETIARFCEGQDKDYQTMVQNLLAAIYEFDVEMIFSKPWHKKFTSPLFHPTSTLLHKTIEKTDVGIRVQYEFQYTLTDINANKPVEKRRVKIDCLFARKEGEWHRTWEKWTDLGPQEIPAKAPKSAAIVAAADVVEKELFEDEGVVTAPTD